eukprot:3261960-Karenia_brevis.AAC.1
MSCMLKPYGAQPWHPHEREKTEKAAHCSEECDDLQICSHPPSVRHRHWHCEMPALAASGLVSGPGSAPLDLVLHLDLDLNL